MALTKCELTQMPQLAYNPITRLKRINAGQATGRWRPLIQALEEQAQLLLTNANTPGLELTLNPSVRLNGSLST
ncbi:uncharacterized, partial [Tachysurus ichikawai]